MGKKSLTDKLSKIFTFIGVPCFATCLVAIYIMQKDLSETLNESKESEIEFLKTLNENNSKFQNAQIELLKEQQSDILLKRLADAKEYYHQDLMQQRQILKELKRLLDSVGVRYNVLNTAYNEFNTKLIKNKEQSQKLYNNNIRLSNKVDSLLALINTPPLDKKTIWGLQYYPNNSNLSFENLDFGKLSNKNENVGYTFQFYNNETEGWNSINTSTKGISVSEIFKGSNYTFDKSLIYDLGESYFTDSILPNNKNYIKLRYLLPADLSDLEGPKNWNYAIFQIKEKDSLGNG